MASVLCGAWTHKEHGTETASRSTRDRRSWSKGCVQLEPSARLRRQRRLDASWFRQTACWRRTTPSTLGRSRVTGFRSQKSGRGRATGSRMAFCSKCAVCFVDKRAAAQCTACPKVPSGCSSQVRKPSSGIFTGRFHTDWIFSSFRRPSLREATLLEDAFNLSHVFVDCCSSIWYCHDMFMYHDGVELGCTSLSASR